jgi:hypothetical protein
VKYDEIAQRYGDQLYAAKYDPNALPVPAVAASGNPRQQSLRRNNTVTKASHHMRSGIAFCFDSGDRRNP